MGNSRWAYWMGGAAAVIIGLDAYGWHLFSAQIASKNYPNVTGWVTHCRMENDPSGKTDLTRQHFIFDYAYQYRGHGFSGRTYRYLENISPQFALANLPEGKSMPVFYNPKNPGDALLARGFSVDDFSKLLQAFFGNVMLFSLLGLAARWRVRLVFPAQQIWQS